MEIYFKLNDVTLEHDQQTEVTEIGIFKAHNQNETLVLQSFSKYFCI